MIGRTLSHYKALEEISRGGTIEGVGSLRLNPLIKSFIAAGLGKPRLAELRSRSNEFSTFSPPSTACFSLNAYIINTLTNGPHLRNPPRTV